MLNVKFNMKASECERTGVVAHICRNKVWYITGTGLAVVGSIAATWWCCYKKTQEVRDGFFAKVGGPDADLITLLSNTDAKGNDKQIKNILSKFFKVNNGALESNNSAKAIDFLAKLKDWKNDKVSCCAWFDAIKDSKDKNEILTKLNNVNDTNIISKFTLLA